MTGFHLVVVFLLLAGSSEFCGLGGVPTASYPTITTCGSKPQPDTPKPAFFPACPPASTARARMPAGALRWNMAENPGVIWSGYNWIIFLKLFRKEVALVPFGEII